MKKISIVKRFLGTSNYMAKLTFWPSRKYYNGTMRVQIEIFEGRNSEGEWDCYSIAEVAQKILAFYESKIGHELEIRRLARWFIEYLEEAGITPPEMHVLLRDMQSTPQEIAAREGYTEAVVEEIEEIAEEAEEEGEEFIEEALEQAQEEEDDDDDDDDEEEDSLEEAVEEVIEEAIEDEDEIIEEVLEEVVEEELEEAIEDAIEEDGTVDEDDVEDAIEDIAEEIAEEVLEDTQEKEY